VDNQPYGRAFERLHELLYPVDHPYHWPVIGYLDDIAAASLDDVASFFGTWYSPANAVLAVSGDIDAAEALAAVERWFGDLPAGATPPPVTPPPPAPPGGSREVLPDEVELSRLYLGFSGPAYGTADWYALDLLTSVLTGGRSSPLYLDLVHERQLAQDAGAFLLPTELCATFAVVATVRPGVEAAALEEAIWEHLASAAERPASNQDLDRARNRTVTGHLDALQQLDQRADALCRAATFLGDAAVALEEVDRYLRLGEEDLKAAASRWLSRTRSATVLVAPRQGER